jgi:hypothetical protein
MLKAAMQNLSEGMSFDKPFTIKILGSPACGCQLFL